jgi:hypothetical protein
MSEPTDVVHLAIVLPHDPTQNIYFDSLCSQVLCTNGDALFPFATLRLIARLSASRDEAMTTARVEAVPYHGSAEDAGRDAAIKGQHSPLPLRPALAGRSAAGSGFKLANYTFLLAERFDLPDEFLLRGATTPPHVSQSTNPLTACCFLAAQPASIRSQTWRFE